MKKQLTALLLTVITAFSFAINAYAENQHNIEENMDFNLNVKQFVESTPYARPMSLMAAKGKIAVFYAIDQHQFLGEDIRYSSFEFVNNKLYKVNMRFTDQSQAGAERLKRKLFKHWGRGKEVLCYKTKHHTVDSYKWSDDKLNITFCFIETEHDKNNSGLSLMVTHLENVKER